MRDRVAHTIIDIRSSDGSTVRFYNSAEEEFMKLRNDRASKRKTAGCMRSWQTPTPIKRRTRSSMAPFAEMVQATRPYADGEMYGLL